MFITRVTDIAGVLMRGGSRRKGDSLRGWGAYL